MHCTRSCVLRLTAEHVAEGICFACIGANSFCRLMTWSLDPVVWHANLDKRASRQQTSARIRALRGRTDSARWALSHIIITTTPCYETARPPPCGSMISNAREGSGPNEVVSRRSAPLEAGKHVRNRDAMYRHLLSRLTELDVSRDRVVLACITQRHANACICRWASQCDRQRQRISRRCLMRSLLACGWVCGCAAAHTLY